MRRLSVLRVLVLCSLTAAPALAQEAPPAPIPGELVAVTPVQPGVLVPVPAAALASALRPAPVPMPEAMERRRPRALVPLYSGLVALNALDVHSTYAGLSTGRAREANPLMKPFVGNSAAFVAVKAGLTATTIWMTERSRKKHPKRALVGLIVSNAALAAVVAHNYRVAKR